MPRRQMSLDKIDDYFIFIYDLEPSEWCSTFRFESPNFHRADLAHTASFSLWKNMLVVFYAIPSGAYPFDVLRARVQYFATIIVTCYGWLTGKPLELIQKNWVEVETEGQVRKRIAGTFQNISEPPIE